LIEGRQPCYQGHHGFSTAAIRYDPSAVVVGIASQKPDTALMNPAVSETKRSWFHCGRCGKLFQAVPGLINHRACTACGADPRTPTLEAVAALSAAASSLPVRRKEQQRRSRTGRKKNDHLMLKLVLGWTLALAVIILTAKILWPSRSQVVQQQADTAIKISDEDAQLLQDATKECSRVLTGFISAAAPEQRSQFVRSQATTASRMARFYSLNPIPGIQAETLKLSASEILFLPGGERAFQTRWQTPNGNIYDAVFRRENDEWRLDWDHFARYSDYPWALFITGLGPDEGEFRMLARERLAEERKNEPTISIVLHSPRPGNPREPGMPSPEFLVPRSERSGQLLDAAFKLARDGGSVFDGKVVDINPEEMIRVRVIVRRFKEDNERKFEITEVLACHWFSVDDPGVQPLVREPAGQPDEAGAGGSD
jgi:hypothetical protein